MTKEFGVLLMNSCREQILRLKRNLAREEHYVSYQPLVTGNIIEKNVHYRVIQKVSIELQDILADMSRLGVSPLPCKYLCSLL